jgi:plasmid stabilization system protein ParE
VKLKKTPVFLLDVEDCADYLVTEAGEEVARRWKAELDRIIELIRSQPEVGRLRQDLPFAGIRTYFLREFPRYLVFYRLRKQTIEFLRVRHGMMHLPGLFEGGRQRGS